MNRLQRQARRSRDRVHGESDAFSQAMTFAAGPVMFGLLGRFLGNVTGTNPWMLLGGIALGIFGSSATLYYRYQARMAHLDADKPWQQPVHPNLATAPADTPAAPFDTDAFLESSGAS